MADWTLGLAVGLLVGLLLLLLLLGLLACFLQRRRDRSPHQELLRAVPSILACPAPVIQVSQGSWDKGPREIPFTVPPCYKTGSLRTDTAGEEIEECGMKIEAERGVLTHRGSLSVQSWYPVGSVLTGLYSAAPLNEVVVPPPGMSTRLCFSVEYRHGSEQLVVSLLRLGNLPPRFHGNMTMVELRLLPDDRRPRQAKARGTGPDPEFSNYFVFQVSRVCVSQSTLSMCVLSVAQDGKRHAVGRVLFALAGELGHAGRVLWRDLETEHRTQCSEVGDVHVTLSYNPTLQRLSVVVLRARGLQLLTDTSVCVKVSLQIHAKAVKMRCSCVVKGEADPTFNHRSTFKLRVEHLDEACVRFELQQLSKIRSEPPTLLGVLVLGPFMYARGPQLQHWMDMINTPQEPIELWHGLSRAT